MFENEYRAVYDYVRQAQWDRAYSHTMAEHEATIVHRCDADVSPLAQRYLESADIQQLYRHQSEAIDASKYHHTCVATGTASGKTLVFHLAALNMFQRFKTCTVLAIYPTKALAREQCDRWQTMLNLTGLQDIHVGVIDGSVPQAGRPAILRECRVIIMTPDVMHAWLLSHLKERSIIDFLSFIQLVVVDEVHSYTGVFGSNAAFLFRRLLHVMTLLGNHPRFIATSATIANPRIVIENLISLPFTVIGPERDTSQKYAVRIEMVSPPSQASLFQEVTELLTYLAKRNPHRFICFVDSRKQVEQYASLVGRGSQPATPEHSEVSEEILADMDDEEEDIEEQTDEEKPPEDDGPPEFTRLEKADVLPFRSGYEKTDLMRITERLNSSSLRGIISTSALELGMDIQGLDIAVLLGVPPSATSLWQRIGRIGRHTPGLVLLINTGSIADQAIFRNPQDLLRRPLAESALYLANNRIQYIHAMCLARQGGEHDMVTLNQNNFPVQTNLFASTVRWPQGFLDLCQRERIGDIPLEMQSMKLEGGDDPHHTFPLRDVESQFTIVRKIDRQSQYLGSISHSQLMREAYPGAMYFYIMKPLRVMRINLQEKQVYVRKERRYSTKPNTIPPHIYLDDTPQEDIVKYRHGKLLVAEYPMLIVEQVTGFKERRGSHEYAYDYPITEPITFTKPSFKREYHTTGIVMMHPALEDPHISFDNIATLLLEAFFLHVGFERQDINTGSGTDNRKRILEQESRFVTLFDNTYGSLHLTSRILEGDLLQRVWETAYSLSRTTETLIVDLRTQNAMQILCSDLAQPRMRHLTNIPIGESIASLLNRIILPGSIGRDPTHGNKEFHVKRVFMHHRNGLSYQGKLHSFNPFEGDIVVPVATIMAIPGVSSMGMYDVETGDIVQDVLLS